MKLIHDKAINVNGNVNAQHGQCDTALQETLLEDEGEKLDRQRDMLQDRSPLPASQSSIGGPYKYEDPPPPPVKKNETF